MKSNAASSRRFFYGWVVLGAAFLATAVAFGNQYSAGVLLKPIINEFGWSRAMTAGAFSLGYVTNGIAAILLGGLTDRYGPRITVLMGGLLLGAGLLLSSRMHSLWEFYVYYGVMVGMGAGGVYVPLASVVARWFDKFRGLALGITAGGIGAGTLIFSPVVGEVNAAMGWRAAYAVLGIVALVVIAACSLLLSGSPRSKGLLPYGNKGETAPVAVGRPVAAPRSSSFRRALQSLPFWLLSVTYICEALGRFVVMTHIVAYSTDIGVAPLVAANILGVIGGASVGGRIVMGTASDRIGSRRALAICLAVNAVMMLTLPLLRQTALLFLFAIIFGFCYGGVVPQIPAVSGRIFGLAALGAIYGALFTAGGVGAAVGSTMAGYVYDRFGSYTIAFLVGGASIALSMLLALLIKERKLES